MFLVVIGATNDTPHILVETFISYGLVPRPIACLSCVPEAQLYIGCPIIERVKREVHEGQRPCSQTDKEDVLRLVISMP